MARDRKAEADRRDARARAAGFTSYGQQYRAKRAGFRGDGKAWNTTLDAKRLGGVQRSGGSRLEGYAQTRAGVVLSARRDDPAAMRELQKAVNRFGPRRRAQIVYSPDGGQVRNYARFGGVPVGNIQGPVSSDEDDYDEYAPGIGDYLDGADGDFYDGGSGTAGTVTVTIA